MRQRGKERCWGGFSLVEVVIALGVFGFSILLLLGVFRPLISNTADGMKDYYLAEADERYYGWIKTVEGDLSGTKMEALISALESGPVIIYSGTMIDWEAGEVVLFTGGLEALEGVVEAVSLGAFGWTGVLYELKIEREGEELGERAEVYLPVRIGVRIVDRMDPTRSVEGLKEELRRALEGESFGGVVQR